MGRVNSGWLVEYLQNDVLFENFGCFSCAWVHVRCIDVSIDKEGSIIIYILRC